MPADIQIVPLLARALHHIQATHPRTINSPPTQPRRAAVALIIRVVPSTNVLLPAQPPTLSQFFKADWVNDPNARPELLYIHRENSDSSFGHERIHKNTDEAHVAFPGGRQEPDDEGGLYTAMRQTWEELGIDLAEPSYTYIGQLDDREITTSLGKRLLMILSPFVFLQLTPHAPPPDPIPSTTLHWTSLSTLVSFNPPQMWSAVTVDASSRIVPKNSTILRLLVRVFIGTMQFPAIVLQPPNRSRDQKGLPPNLRLKLWGLSLGMTLDLISYMTLSKDPLLQDSPAPSSPLSEFMNFPFQDSSQDFKMEYVAPSLASIVPRFSYPDVNFWIWVFGKRYREVIRGWQASVREAGINNKRINWPGSALTTFYAAIRKALVVVIVARILGVLLGASFALWWIFS